jgi:hypothetical protein
MHRRPSLLAAVAAVAAATLALACHSGAGPDSPAPDGAVVARVTAPDTLRLHVGTAGVVDGGKLTVEFLKVEGDSRCPGGVTCVWQGDAAVALRLTSADGRRAGTTLHTALNLQPKSVEYDGYDVTLADVQPYPKAQTPIEPGAYVAVISVARR